MNSLGRIFIRGLVTILPLAVTIYILYSAILILDGLLGGLLRQILPTYIPGLGLFAIVALIFVFGLLLNNLVVGRILSYTEHKLLEVPLIRAVYSPLKEMMNMFSKQGQKKLQQVAFVKFSENGPMVMGLITRENFEELKLGALTTNKVAVYFPFSYALGGYTVLVDASQVTPVNLPIEKAMSLAVTGWVKTEKTNEENRP